MFSIYALHVGLPMINAALLNYSSSDTIPFNLLMSSQHREKQDLVKILQIKRVSKNTKYTVQIMQSCNDIQESRR